ncbi:hypothetical protein evm_000190 [Chilo suppressalis]|nr:hypothetical protein evm_000190 [Chilo suppressalis]
MIRQLLIIRLDILPNTPKFHFVMPNEKETLNWILIFIRLNLVLTYPMEDILHGNLEMGRCRNKYDNNDSFLRQRDTPSRFKKKAQEESSTYHEDKKGPQRNEHYDPSYGFEPYWTGGDWALNKFAEQHKTNGSKYLCEDTCSPIYKRFGVICGRNKKLEHRTFKDYCEMRLLDCLGRDGWFIAYRGECKIFYYHPTTHMQSRASYHIQSFNERHPKLG